MCLKMGLDAIHQHGADLPPILPKAVSNLAQFSLKQILVQVDSICLKILECYLFTLEFPAMSSRCLVLVVTLSITANSLPTSSKSYFGCRRCYHSDSSLP